MGDTLIRVDGLSKKFCLSLKRSLWYGLRDLGSELAGRRHGGGEQLRAEEFWALRDIEFELERGECLGLIGHNGAGKTTLLRILNGLIKPDAGRVELRGRVGALIALGAGFNPILTGRENIYINASVLGLSKRHVDSKLEEIVEFAEIGPFLDTPVRNYSSGMNVRLGFSVAAILLEPDILFLDEVLAVGDIGFVVKCLNAVRQLTQGAAVVFVSHNMHHIAGFCTRVLVMDHGETLLDTSQVSTGINSYFGLIGDQTPQTAGSGAARVLGFELEVNGEVRPEAVPGIASGDQISVQLQLRIEPTVKAAKVTINILDESLVPVISSPLANRDLVPVTVSAGEHRFCVSLGRVDLNRGRYSFVALIQDAEQGATLVRVQGLSPFSVICEGSYWGKIVRPALLESDGSPARPVKSSRELGH